ncbi:hypothetical protein A2647_01360 [Candidatus Nomurabacteria bacterium RIFCSPHIGHO2_01_FULL_40_24b]|uniref:Uncharacterized protein n=1 Tax=Candidatus Nomurabacteria bacterium RIFCSPHIGHO2_01_FULL_40_24b TaxID=1801739 RepID=A0A1F6V5R5_9BACT|nr:MAG: hypothetical protein A2647_01360 [Candidatus Nomurabacteria bacterium RIFCSPHIGHO2_01_FULL_40_24b]
MLPKKNRASKKDLEGVFRKGLFLTSPNITFKYLKIKNNFSGTDKNFRISFIAPKAISKSAVKRNFLKRRGYRLFKKHIDSLPFPIVGAFIFNKNNVENLEDEIKKILNKIH